MNQAPRPLPSQVPADLAAVIGRCLEKDAANRYRQASEVCAALEAVQSGCALPRVRTVRRAWPRRRWLALAAIGAMLIAVGAGIYVGGFLQWLPRRERSRDDCDRHAGYLRGGHGDPSEPVAGRKPGGLCRVGRDLPPPGRRREPDSPHRGHVAARPASPRSRRRPADRVLRPSRRHRRARRDLDHGGDGRRASGT